MTRLPTVDSDTNAWGAVLNSFLQAGHNATGTNSNSMTVFNIQDDAYGAPTNGTSDAMSAINAALTAIYANKGGVLVFPYCVNGYALASNIVIDPGQYSGGGGIIVLLMGNTLKPSHTNWCIDVKTNTFGGNNSVTLGLKTVVIHGDGAVIAPTGSAASAGAGGIRFTDTCKCYAEDIAVNGYAAGDAVRFYISTNDQSTWCEHNELSHISGIGNTNGLYLKAGSTAVLANSFLGNVFRSLAFQGTTNNAKLFNLEGTLSKATLISCGGYYNQSSATGGNAFYLNGGYPGTNFLSPWTDTGGSATQSADTDIVFGANYTNTLGYLPTIINSTGIKLPASWNTQLIVPVPLDSAANPSQVLRSQKTFYVSTTGSDSTGDGLTSGTAWATVSHAYDTIQKSFDENGQDITIQLADGTYTGQVVCSGKIRGSGGGSVILQGNTGTPGNVVISTTSTDAVYIKGGANVILKGIKMQTTTSGNGLVVENFSFVSLDVGNQFGACATRHMIANIQCRIEVDASYTITGNSPVHYEAAGNAIIILSSGTVDATSRAFSGNFATAHEGAQIIRYGTNFTTTSSTGNRYYCYAGGIIQTFGAGASFLPGNVAGFADGSSGGYYI